MPIRMKDIARDLGISPMAVSKALRDHSDIGAATKQRVLKRAAELNYRVDSVARSMVTGRSYLVGLVVPDLMQSYLAEIADAITATLAPEGYHLLISHTGESAKEEGANLELLIARKVDGLIIASAQQRALAFRSIRIPYVLIDRRVAGLEANYIGTKNEDVGFLATEHLIEQGCRRIAHLRGPALSTAAGRLRGYARALRKHGLRLGAEYIVDGGHDDLTGFAGMQTLLESNARPDGVFCFNDPVAIGAMRAIFQAGLVIPGDIALVGAANMHFSDILKVPLSTVDQGTRIMGTEAAKLLLGSMGIKRRPVARHIILPAQLIPRASSLRAAVPGG